MPGRFVLWVAIVFLLFWPVSASAQLFDPNRIDMGDQPNQGDSGNSDSQGNSDDLNLGPNTLNLGSPGDRYLGNPGSVYPGAKSVDVGGVSVQVVTPGNFCSFDETNPIDAAILAQIAQVKQPNNVPLAIYIDCNELIDIRAGTLDHMTRYLSVGTTQNALYENLAGQEQEMVASACGNVSVERALGEPIKATRQRMQTFAEGTDFLGMESLGVVKQTADTCYAGYLSKTNIDGTTVTQVNIVSFFVLKGKLIVVNDYTGYYAGALDALLAEQETYVARLRGSNLF
jgi:hypothetical protein